ncbi:hypothetical protein HC251_21285 [Iamia sp. SCSIO 61187]|uniref:hypothetical protein n=1 Tax=Iamia sp. SCSIO 61187 TaxID=2722752 RepID=UPI001C6303AA|nr:hypothetical protein [Iamia sp. SCSIO 61187]QYG94716.1 hypothetical protein HC251_21285 [Iamia sp. SCSIO 61187]
MRYRPLIAGAAALALTLSLSACGDDDGDDTSSDTTEAEAETEDTAATDETEAETEDTEAEGEEAEAGAAVDLTSLLVTPEDVGEGFVEAEYETSTEPGPCGTSIDEEYPSDDIAGTVLAEEELQLFLQHEVRSYADEGTAAETLAASQDALSCETDTTEPGLTLSAPTDVSEAVGTDAYAIEVTSEADGTEGAIVVAQVANVLSVFQFVGPAGVEEGPDPVAIVTANVEAIQAAIG